MKSMNDMSMKELLEMDRKINQHFFEEAHFLRKLNRLETTDPPEWAREIDDDIEFQLERGAKELDIECKNPFCGKWTKSVSSFCSPVCHDMYVKYQEYLQAEKQREKTTRLMNGGERE